MRILKLVLAMVIPAAVCLIAGIFAVRTDSAGAWALTNIAFIVAMAAIFVGLLGWKVGGSQLSLEARVTDLATESEKVRHVVDALIKSMVVMIDGYSNTPTREHFRLLGTYVGRIKHLGSADVIEHAKADLEELRQTSSLGRESVESS